MTVDDALAQLKIILAAADPPAPAEALAAIYAYPADYDSLSLSSLPVLIVGQQVNTRRAWRRKAIGTGLHIWTAELILLLAPGPITNDEQLALVEQKQNPWPKALADVLLADQQLNGTAAWIGGGSAVSELFTYWIGHVHFWQKKFWGMRFLMPVAQTHGQEMRP